MIGGNIVMYNGMTLNKLTMKRWEIKMKRQDGKNCFFGLHASLKTSELHTYLRRRRLILLLGVYHPAVSPASQYIKYLHQAPRLRCPDSGHIYVTETVVTLGRPQLHFEQLPSYWQKGRELRFTVRVRNPLNQELTDCVSRFDGNLMEEGLTLSYNLLYTF